MTPLKVRVNTLEACYIKIVSVLLLSLSLCHCSNQSSSPQKIERIALKGVTAACISNNNRYTLYAAPEQGIGVWDNIEHKLLYQWRHHKNKLPNIIALSISGNSQFALTAEKRNIVWWDLSNGKSLRFLALPSDIQAIALSYQGSRALIAMQNAKALYLDLTTGQTIQSLQHLETVNTVALSNNGRYALTGSDDKLAVLWDLQQAKPLHQWLHPKRVRYVTFSPSANYALSSASQSEVNLWHVQSGKLLSKIVHKSITATIAAFSNDEKSYALGLLPNKIRIYNSKDSRAIDSMRLKKYKNWKPTSTFVYGLSFDKQQLLSIDSSGMLSYWGLTKPNA